MIKEKFDNNSPARAGKRLLSLDALRGFDMFWIVSGEGIFHGLAKAVQQKYGLLQNEITWQISITDHLSLVEKIVVSVSNQLHHSVWNGFTFYDLIFPLFIFIAGISMPFSYAKQLSSAPGAKRNIYRALIKRTLLLLLLGMVVNGLLQFKSFEETRFASVLGRIALSCFFAAIIYLNTSLPWRIAWVVFILVGYWLTLMFIPVPGFGAGILTPEANLSAYIDRLFLPGKLHRRVYDPEGLFSTIPAVATALLGILTGEMLRNPAYTPISKVVRLFFSGFVLMLLGLAWNAVFPINKTIWSSSFVLYAGGWSLLIFSLFYWVIDIWNLNKWAMPFVWLGCNSILIYMASHGLVNFLSTSGFLLEGITLRVDAWWHDAILWTGVALIQFAALYGLYRKKIFLKL